MNQQAFEDYNDQALQPCEYCSRLGLSIYLSFFSIFKFWKLTKNKKIRKIFNLDCTEIIKNGLKETTYKYNFNSGFSTKMTCAFLQQVLIQELLGLNTFKPRKRQYLSHYWSDKGFTGIVVNWILPSLQGGIRVTEIKLSFSSLSRFYIWKNCTIFAIIFLILYSYRRLY